MLIKLNKGSILLASILLSRGENRHFTDIELAEKLRIKREVLLNYLKENKIEEIRGSKKYQIPCENCGADISICEGVDVIFCKRCSKKISNIPFWSFGLETEKTIGYLREKILGLFGDYTILKKENNKITLEWEKSKIALLISTEKIGLNDLYILKGWSEEFSPDFHITVGFYPTFTLSSLYSRGDAGLLTLEKIFDKKLFENEISNLKKNVIERKKEFDLGLDYKKSKDLIEIENFWKRLLQDIEIYALQRGSENSKIQGEKFQEYVIDLLRITIFDAKPLGNKNQPDGVIFIYKTNKDKSLLIPTEIKTSEEGIIHLQEHESQIRKYLTGFTNEYVTTKYSVPYFIIFGHDFDLDNDKDKQIIKTLESNFGIKIILFPLKSLIHLVNLYFKYKISYIDYDKVEDLLQSNYIEMENIDKLMSDLKDTAEEREKDLFKKTEEIIRKYGY